MNAHDLLPWIPGLPLAGFLALALLGGRLPRRAAAAVGCGSVGLSALLTIVAASDLLSLAAGQQVVERTLWTWIAAEGLTVPLGLRLDALSLLMVSVVTGVGFLIHVYSAEFMGEDDGCSRFFAYLNLFVCAMLLLVLADNFVVLLLGWEGVGLCSYLLIGFWYKDPANGAAARKAFIVTRTGDVALLVGMFVLHGEFGTLDMAGISAAAPGVLGHGTEAAALVALLLLGGAVGKSAQLPLQTWLPDAMAGPSPVSALIHAATMVTAGVYLIARNHVLFELAPGVMAVVALVGAATLLLAGTSALAQRDLKRVLAYSTISQIGYMFLALGVGAWTAAMFHFLTHAFFKALLFLAAGAVIHALSHEHDIFRMGGLRKKLPVVFWTFLVGAGSLAALPLVTSGFFSKDMILTQVWASERGGNALWLAGVAGAAITALYTGRVFCVTFLGPQRTKVSHAPGKLMTAPLVVLAALATAAGFLETPHLFGHVRVFSDFLAPALPEFAGTAVSTPREMFLIGTAAAATVLGVGTAAWLYARQSGERGEPGSLPQAAEPIRRYWLAGWGFDALYDWILVRPFTAVARLNRADFIDRFYDASAEVCRLFHSQLSRVQSGYIRHYAMGIAAGAILVLLVAVYL